MEILEHKGKFKNKKQPHLSDSSFCFLSYKVGGFSGLSQGVYEISQPNPVFLQ